MKRGPLILFYFLLVGAFFVVFFGFNALAFDHVSVHAKRPVLWTSLILALGAFAVAALIGHLHRTVLPLKTLVIMSACFPGGTLILLARNGISVNSHQLDALMVSFLLAAIIGMVSGSMLAKLEKNPVWLYCTGILLALIGTLSIPFFLAAPPT